MNKIGIRAHDIGTYDAKTLAQKVKDCGFEGVQLVFKKAIDTPVDFNDLTVIKQAFNQDVNIMMLGAYFNPVHPDIKQVQSGIDYFKQNLKVAKELGCLYVGTETGSYMGSPWGYMPQNHTQEALDQVIDVFKDLCDYAHKFDVNVALEGAWAHVASTPQRVKEIVDKVNHPNLSITVDLYNFLNLENHEQRMDILKESIDLLKESIVIFHLKDYIVENQKLKQVGLGQGLMDYPAIIKMISSACPNSYLIFEGVTGDDITSSYQLIKKLLQKGK